MNTNSHLNNRQKVNKAFYLVKVFRKISFMILNFIRIYFSEKMDFFTQFIVILDYGVFDRKN